MRRVLIALISMSVFASCEQEELLPGRFISDQIGQAMMSDATTEYSNQLYFDLSSGKLMAQNKRDSWDLGFSCDPDAPNILVNPSMLQAVAATGVTNFDQSFNAANYNFEYQRAETYYTRGFLQRDFDTQGNPKGEVFLLDLGRDLENQKRGVLKLQLTVFSQGKYSFKVAPVNGGDVQTVEVTTDSGFNYQYLSLQNPETVLSLEPPKASWDLHFTKYMERLWDGTDTVDYSVTGCLLNPYKCAAYEVLEATGDTTLNYANFTAFDVYEGALETRSNVIGHSWKYYDLDAGAYQVRTNKLYLIRDESKQYYKLHFIGFYDGDGRKGAVSFEYVPI